MHQTYVDDHICGMRTVNVVNIMRAHHHIYMSTCRISKSIFYSIFNIGFVLFYLFK